jgi:hypothetical protein
MKRLNLFVKGNVDVHDALIYSRVNGRIQWNGLNTLLGDLHPNHVVRAHHEPAARWDHAGIEGQAIPEELTRRQLNLGTFTLTAQYQSAMFERPWDVVVLSIQSEVMNPLSRHRRDGYSFMAAGSHNWAPDDQRWLADEFSSSLVTPEASMQHLTALVKTLQSRSRASVLVFNMSSAIPGEQVVSHRGLEDALATRIRAFNLALVETSAKLDFSIVDVDHLVARAGADRLKLDANHYMRDGYRLMAAEVARLMEARGVFDNVD